MATTTNFGWETPDDTDLVKDGALAIRTLGSAIDTSLVDLKGGTTGQILSKASNSDLDYTWINNDQGDITEVQAGTGISVASGTGPIPIVTNTVATAFDAKGDLIGGTGADTFARLPVGTNNQVLTADSTTATGLKWATASSGGMTLLSTTTLSGSSTTISSIDQTYTRLIAYIYGATNDTQASYRKIYPNGSQNSATYQITATNTTLETQTSQPIYWNSISYYIDRTDANNVFTLIIDNYASTAAMKTFTMMGRYISSGDSTSRASWANGGIATTSAISSLEFVQTTGSFTAGTVKLYGVK